MTPEEESVRKDHIDELFTRLDELQKSANVNAVFGQPVQVGEKTVIPIASVAYGFGLGFGEQEEEALRPTSGEEAARARLPSRWAWPRSRRRARASKLLWMSRGWSGRECCLSPGPSSGSRMHWSASWVGLVVASAARNANDAR